MMRIPGKRKQRPATVYSPDIQHRGRGRPIKPSSELSIPRATRNLQLRLYHEQAQLDIPPSRDLLSSFESLPNELIQQIFFLCFEVNLARASPHLAAVLSTNSTYNALILFAYFDDDGNHPVEAKYFLPAEYREVSLKEKLRLQAGILQCGWFTLDRLRSCLPALSMLKMVQAWHAEHNQETMILEEYDNPSLITPNKELLWLAELPDLTDKVRLENHFVAQSVALPAFVEQRTKSGGVSSPLGETYQPRIMTWTSSISKRDQGRYSKTPHAGVSTLAARVIPDWVVTGGPWTKDKLEVLQLLRQGFQYVEQDFVLTISAKAVMLGMANAIQESYVPALTTLLELHSAVFVKAEGIAESDKPFLTPPTCHTIPIELFHLATRQKADSSTMLWLLVRAGIDAVTHDDSILTAWALEARSQAGGNNVAEWLLRHMDGTNEYHLERRAHLFEKGAVSWRVSNAEPNFPPASKQFSEELGYLMGGRAGIPTNPDNGSCG